MKIQIVNVDVQTKMTKTNKPYSVSAVIYKDVAFDNKVKEKTIMPFGVTQYTQETMANAKPGEFYEVEVLKNAQGFLDWLKAEKTTGDAPPKEQEGIPQGIMKATASLSPKSTYETPEERAAKQIYIVRQSSISAAINLLGTNTKAPLTVGDVLKTAEELETFVFGYTKDTPQKTTEGSRFDNMDDDTPF
jgi:hypothetical protein